MKKFYISLLTLVVCATSLFAQTPEKLNYQAIVRNSSDMILTNTNIGMQISILESSNSGTAVYVETQTPTTNANGLVTIEIGTGTVVSGTFNTIDWSSNSYFIKTEIDITGGTSYTISGTSQLLSVPYALHAKTVETIADNAVDGTNISLNSEAAGDVMYYDGTNWVRLAKGTAGQKLAMNTGATAPEWVADPATASLARGKITRANLVATTSGLLALDTSEINIGGIVDIPNNSLTIPTTGQYQVNAHTTIQAAGSNYYISLVLYINGVEAARVEANNSGSNNRIPLTISEVFTLNATDEITLSTEYGGNANVQNIQLSAFEIPTAIVINAANTTVNDQAASGYIDIGNTRIQWGIQSGPAGTRAVTLPAPFANTNYVVTGGAHDYTNVSGTFDLQVFSLTTSGFNGRLRFNNTSSVIDAGEAFQWQAIGMKP